MTQAAVLAELPERLRPAAGPPRTYLVTGGVAKCGVCSMPLEAKPSSKGTRGYACTKTKPHPGCGKIRIAKEPFEEDIAVQVLARLATPAAVEQLSALMTVSAQTGSALAVEIGAVEDELRELGRDLGAGRVNRVAFLAAQDEYDARLQKLRAQAQATISVDSLTGILTPEDLADWWENGSTVQERHDLVRVLVDEIRIMPSRRRGFHGFDPSRVVYVWAAG